jgi:hypothetical protein
VIFNPAARGNKARHFRHQLDAIGSQCALKATTAPGDARRLAAEAVGEGFDLIVAAGGDGTVNEVLNGLGDAPDGLARARLGVLPLGTVNVFARELKIPLRIERAWNVLQRGREMRIDLPRVEFSANGTRQKQYFAQLAGAGMDARAIELVDWGRPAGLPHRRTEGLAGTKTQNHCPRRRPGDPGRTGFDWQRPVLRRIVWGPPRSGPARRTAGRLRFPARQLADDVSLRTRFACAAKIAGARRATRSHGGLRINGRPGGGL